MESVKLSNNLKNISGGAFIRCSSLKRIDISVGNPDYKLEDGVLYSKDGKQLICCPAGKAGKLEVLDGIDYIDRGAFAG